MANQLLDRIKSRCYWQTTIRPERFMSNRIEDYSRLFPIVRESSVSLRGWDFPHVDGRREARRRGEDWVGEELEWGEHLELWRLYQSGQFVSVLGLWYDWRGRSSENPEGRGPTDFLPLWDTIYRFTKIYEFAARLALTEVGDSAMRVQVKIGNVQGRVLYQEDPQRSPLHRYEIQMPSFSYPPPDSKPIIREALIANPQEFAAMALRELFGRFDFAVKLEGIRVWQEELNRR